MATQKRRKRLQVPLNPEVWDTLEELSEVTGRSTAALAEEIIVEAMPAMTQLIRALDQLDLSPADSFRDLAHLIDRLSQEARQLSMELEEEGNNRT